MHTAAASVAHNSSVGKDLVDCNMIFRTVLVAVLAVGVLAEYQITEEQRDTFKRLVTDYCKKNGAEDKAKQVIDGVKSFVDCAKGIIDPETAKQEFEAAKTKGTLDEVFGKYCKKAPQLKTCLNSLLTTVTPCLEQKIKDQMSAITNGADKVIEFVCHNEGDRLAVFFAEGGPSCFEDKKEAIQACAETLRQNVPDLDTARQLTLAQQCTKFDELSTCVVKALEGCSNPTPSNMIESLIKYARKNSPCQTAATKN